MTGIPEIFGTIPSWIVAGMSSGIFWKAAQWQLDNRKQRTAEIDAEAKRDLDADKSERDGFAVLIKALQEDVVSVRQEMTGLRAELANARNDHRSCEERLNATEAQLRGVHQQILAGQRSYARLPETNASPAITDMVGQLDRVEKPE